MKKSTVIIWAIIVVVIVLVFQKNWDFFNTKQALNIIFVKEPLPEQPIWRYFLIFFFFGFIAAYIFGFSARFKAKRAIKKLNTTTTKQDKELSDLKREIDALKSVETLVDSQADTIKLDLNTTQKIAKDAPAEKSADKQEKLAADRQTANPSEIKAEDSKEKKN